MKVLFFVSSLRAGGAERVVSVLANYWVKHGHHVVVTTLVSPKTDFYMLDSGISRIGIGYDEESNNIIKGAVRNIYRIRALRKILQDERPDVAISMMTGSNILLGIAALFLKTKVIGSERIHPPAYPLGKAWELARRIVYRTVHAMVAQTEKSAEWLRKNAPSKKIVVIPNPVFFPTANCSPYINPLSVKSERGVNHILLAVGRLDRQKGFDRLLGAYGKIAHDYPDWQLVILGEGSERANLEKQAQQLGINENVSFPGVAGNILDWYEASDAFTLTSRFEGFPNALLEALAHGLPAIAMDCDTGPREILRHGVDGILVPDDDDTGSLERALKKLLDSPKLREYYARNAVDVRERFSLQGVVSMWEKLLHGI